MKTELTKDIIQKKKNVVAYTKIDYCPVCNKKSNETWLDLHQDGAYEFVDTKDAFCHPWINIDPDELHIDVSKKQTVIYLYEYVDMDESSITLNKEQLRIILNPEGFFNKLQNKLAEYQGPPIKLIPEDKKLGYDKYMRLPNFCSRECAKIFIFDCLEKMQR